MAGFLGIKVARLEWATHEKLVARDPDGSYRPEIVVAQWLKYERGRTAKKAGRSELERERARLVRAKAAAAERQLALLDRSLINGDDMIESVKAVCLRIKSKLQAAIPRMARACYHTPSLNEALIKAREEFDLLLAELSALKENGEATQFEVVTDADGESAERSPTGKGPDGSAN